MQRVLPSCRPQDSWHSLCCRKKPGLTGSHYYLELPAPKQSASRPPPFSGKLPQPPQITRASWALTHSRAGSRVPRGGWECDRLPSSALEAGSSVQHRRQMATAPSLRQPALLSPHLPLSLEGKVCRAGNCLGEFNKGQAAPGNHLKRTCFVPVEKPAGTPMATSLGF